MDRLVRWEKVIEKELWVPRRMVIENVVDAPSKMVIEKALWVPRRMVIENVVDAPSKMVIEKALGVEIVASFSGIQGIPEQCTLLDSKR